MQEARCWRPARNQESAATGPPPHLHAAQLLQVVLRCPEVQRTDAMLARQSQHGLQTRGRARRCLTRAQPHTPKVLGTNRSVYGSARWCIFALWRVDRVSFHLFIFSSPVLDNAA